MPVYSAPVYSAACLGYPVRLGGILRLMIEGQVDGLALAAEYTTGVPAVCHYVDEGRDQHYIGGASDLV